MELEVLKIWPDWEATRLIGEGSFGKVYEIVRNNFGIEEHCALKVLSIPPSDAELESMRSEGMSDEDITTYYRGMVEEFVQEIAMMSKLKGNVNIVGYEDYAVVERKNSIGWDILIRMELLTALPNHIRNNSMSEMDVINLSIDMCNALEVCYNHKIIHRDIKLDNIFLSKDGKYKLGDFGVARTIEKTVTGLSKKGTYTYMAPEVYKGEAYGTNVDIYSLGIVMYKLLNNNREPFLPPHPQPITHSSKNNALVKRLSGEVIPPPVNANTFLNKIVLKATNFKAENRYQTPTQMKNDLTSVKNSALTGVAPVLQIDHVATAATRTTAHKSRIGQPIANKSRKNNNYSTSPQFNYTANQTANRTAPPQNFAHNQYANQGRVNSTTPQKQPSNMQYNQNGTANNYYNRQPVAQSKPVVQNNFQGTVPPAKSGVTNKDIYDMAMKQHPVNLNTAEAKGMMNAALKRIVPTFIENGRLDIALKCMDPNIVMRNITNADNNTLFLVIKALKIQLAIGCDAKALSIVTQNVYGVLKRRF